MVNVIINWESKIASNHKGEVDKKDWKELLAMLKSRFAWIRANAFLYLNSDGYWYHQELGADFREQANKLGCHFDKTTKEWYEKKPK